ncbi:hypothetical protein PR048_022795 [Dryococelus australis]|uniref:Uncharacterized protein n=1 Tax=Dryococelus australis TaxID=614101 RepID=A0ABQ9GSD1_9NEOP|nr:hypothetical protein PR048_022795 [Dryococelus australis]
MCKEQHYDQLVSKYAAVEKALHLRLEQANAVRALDKLLDEFYFSVFNPLKHYTIEEAARVRGSKRETKDKVSKPSARQQEGNTALASVKGLSYG